MSNPWPNPPADVATLMAPMSADTINTIFINMLVTLQIRADLWPKEGALRSCMFAVATAAAGFINDRIAATKAGWLPTASGAWLTWLALYMYGQIRTAASFATGAVTLMNNGGGNFNFQPFTWTCQNPTTLATYTNTQAIALGPGPGTTQTVNVQATAQGSASNSAPGTITQIVSSMPNVSCTNALSVLGNDAQPDPSLQLQCWNSIAANSAYGPRSSFAYAVQTALNAVSGKAVNINRWVISPSSHTGNVTTIVASPSGTADPNDVLGVTNNIEAIARPPCVQHVEQSAVTVSYNPALTVYVLSTPGLQASTVQTAIQAALDAYFQAPQTSPIGGRVRPSDGFTGIFGSGVEGAIASAWPPRPTDPTIPWSTAVFDVVGAVDLALLSNQVAANGTTLSIVLVPAA